MSEPRCKECGCTTGGAEYCFEHQPYLVQPKADGSFISDRGGRKHLWFDEPPSADAPIVSAIRALVQQWREKADRCDIRWPDDGTPSSYLRRCADELAALCPAPPEDQK